MLSDGLDNRYDNDSKYDPYGYANNDPHLYVLPLQEER